MRKVRSIATSLILIGLCTGCYAAVVKRGNLPANSELAVIPLQDCTISGQEDCQGSGTVAGTVFARVLSQKLAATPLSRPVAANLALSDDDAVKFAKSKGYKFVLNGEVVDFYNVAPMTFRSDRAAVAIRILDVTTGKVVLFYSDRNEVSNIKTAEDALEQLAEHVASSL